METIKKQATMWTLALITLMTMFSCDEDWWNDWDGGSDITGQWRIVEATGYGPYRQDDYWTFDKNGYFTPRDMAHSQSEDFGAWPVDATYKYHLIMAERSAWTHTSAPSAATT